MRQLRIFFATDIHGSETCFRKFLNAGKAYQADVLIMGGDMTGKMVVPIVNMGKGFHSFAWLGSRRSVAANEIPEVMHQIRMAGCYPYLTNPDEMEKLESDPKLVKEMFHKTVLDSVRQWIQLAEERLQGTGVECYITPGNDDDLIVDTAFENQSSVCNPEKKLMHIKGELEMISSGYSNRTPWNSPREMDEEHLLATIEEMASEIELPHRAIFNFHCPPYDVGLDLAPRLDKRLKPVAGLGGVDTVPVGSTAVLRAIKTFQPMLSLHGHVHESRGAVKINKSVCVNPGSEYTEGILRGCLILVDQKGIRDYLLTAG